MKRAVGVVSIVALGVAANVALWLTVIRPDGEAEGLWKLMDGVDVPTRPDVPPAFPESLRAEEGRRVSLSGVAFLMNAGIEDGRVRWCVLMPPSRYGCCGVSCDPDPAKSVYVDCGAAPWTPSGRQQVMATVEGTLRLERTGGSWCLYTLENATVRPIEP